ncbi:hypothetical protein O181_011670 [Austropuccinia psidii MF-1]|uniref:Retrotransposon gag domain-containing protein n=1 Tax=Austropuccinia psidii MF-1 TaxID=1389203 RepID=A0A9Q3GM50_9BASI|nr:hypothetical protein [Austropuccinia psidii MF-1]
MEGQLQPSLRSLSHHSEPSLLAIMQQMTQIMANIQAASSSEASRPPTFKTTSMKAPECVYGTQPFKVRSFIQSCQLIFHNHLANFSQERKKVLDATSFLIGRAAKWIETYLSKLTNKDTNYLVNSWTLFESQLFTLFGDPNEVRKSEAELDSLRMKEGRHISLYISNFRCLVSTIGDWGERDLIHHFRKRLPSRILDYLASHPSRIDSPGDLIDITLEVDTSNDFSSAKSCASLAGNFRTPSFTSSVNIASFNSHTSLLSSRGDVFEEIQDVGGDNSVSSLHIFFGRTDLPPSYNHDSLGQLWDEEDEPEEVDTVMRVVPPAYHQYLDILSKVKAERLPPQNACDHHIELERSLPPVVVIYYLSNQEENTIRAYTLENVEKGFIQPSSSSTGASSLFVKTKDGGHQLRIDYCKLSSVTRKNKYPVPPMNQLITVFNGSSVLFNIDLHGACNLLRIKEGEEHLT